MKRVVIIGSPGTGKSTFARKLAAKTGLPLIHIDFYYHDPSKDYYHDKPAWRALITKMATEDQWILDGNYGKTMSQRMQRADTIFYFDMPRRTALWGVIKRRLNAYRTVREDMPHGWKEQTGWSFLKYVWTFRKTYTAGTQRLLAENTDKQVVVFKNHKQADAYLQMLRYVHD